MKQIVTSLLLVALCFGAYCQVLPPAYTDSEASSISISVNPAGILFFGPSVDLGYGINSSTDVNLQVRYLPLGMVLQSRKTYEGEEMADFKGLSYGGGVTRFLQDPSSLRPYVGGRLEFGTMMIIYEEREAWQWYEKNSNFILALNGGVRKTFESGVYVNIGAFSEEPTPITPGITKMLPMELTTSTKEKAQPYCL